MNSSSSNNNNNNKQVYVGGDIAEVSGAPAGGVAVFDGSNGVLQGFFFAAQPCLMAAMELQFFCFYFILFFRYLAEVSWGAQAAAWKGSMAPNGVL